MGKKRRYIQRANKFSKKAFNFLDKLDGNVADGDLESSKIDTHISRIVVTDRGNQTMSFVARCHGPGDTTTGNLQADHVIYTVDGVTLHGSAVILIDHTGTGRDKNLAKTLNSPALDSARAAACVGGNNTDVLLSVGEHTISAAVYSENELTKKSDYFVQTFNIARSVITFGTPLADYLQEGSTNGNVKIDLSKLNGKITGKQPGDEVTYDPGTVHGYKIEVLKDVGGTLTAQVIKDALTASNGDTFFIKADGAGADVTDDMLKVAVGEDTTFTVRLTAVGTDGVALVDSFDHTIAVTV